MADVSIIILTRNEHRNIRRCIESCKSFAGEIVVVDDNSTDDTREIAASLGARVIIRALDGDWGTQKTFAIRQATRPWVFLVDADETCTPELAIAVEDAVNRNGQFAYWVQRKTFFPRMNKVLHGALRPDKVLRLMPAKDTSVEGVVHEAIVTPYPQRSLNGCLRHYSYHDWTQVMQKANVYSSLCANKYKQANRKCSFFLNILLRPAWAFFKVYILDRGFLDGKAGWIFSVNHYYLTMMKYVKLYYLYKSDGEL